MRVIVFFDLPVVTNLERKEYYQFRKYLIKKGFLMMQKSVYCKLIQNQQMADQLIKSIKDNRPSTGLVQVMKITEKQYSRIEYMVGSKVSNVIDSDKRLIIV